MKKKKKLYYLGINTLQFSWETLRRIDKLEDLRNGKVKLGWILIFF